MTVQEAVTAEDVKNRFAETLRGMEETPAVTVTSVELTAAPAEFRIRSEDKYGALPCLKISGDENRVLEAAAEAARLSCRIALIRRVIQEQFPGGRFLQSVLSADAHVLVGICGISGKGLIVAAAETSLLAYQALRTKLEPSSGMMRTAELMVASITDPRGMYVGAQGIVLLGECAGIAAEAVATIAQERLRNAGIPFLAKEAELKPGCSVLGVCLNVLRVAADLFAISSRVELWQLVSLTRQPETQTCAITWCTTPEIETATGVRLNEVVAERTQKQLDFFIDSYQLANCLEKGAGEG